MKKLHENPFNIERNYFVYRMQHFVPYLKRASVKLLEKMYFMSKIDFYAEDQVIFDIGDSSDAMYFVVKGVVAIELYNQEIGVCQLDLLSKGSIIGYNNVVKEANWRFRAVVRSNEAAKIIKIQDELLTKIAMNETNVALDVIDMMIDIDIRGLQ